MPKLTSTEAAAMAGVSRSTIWRACKTGKLSAEKSGKDFVIEVSELERVFALKRSSSHETSHPVAAKPDATKPVVASKPDETELVAELRRQIERMEQDKADLRQERDRLLGLVERQSDQVRLLTDQRPRLGWLERWLKGRIS
jgi:excisionase family DNA binding protein